MQAQKSVRERIKAHNEIQNSKETDRERTVRYRIGQKKLSQYDPKDFQQRAESIASLSEEVSKGWSSDKPQTGAKKARRLKKDLDEYRGALRLVGKDTSDVDEMIKLLEDQETFFDLAHKEYSQFNSAEDYNTAVFDAKMLDRFSPQKYLSWDAVEKASEDPSVSWEEYSWLSDHKELYESIDEIERQIEKKKEFRDEHYSGLAKGLSKAGEILSSMTGQEVSSELLSGLDELNTEISTLEDRYQTRRAQEYAWTMGDDLWNDLQDAVNGDGNLREVKKAIEAKGLNADVAVSYAKAIRNEERASEFQEWVSEHDVPVLSDALTVAGNLVGGITGTVDLAAQNIGNIGKDRSEKEVIDYNTLWQYGGIASDTIRGSRFSEDDEWFLNMLYNTGMSVADMFGAKGVAKGATSLVGKAGKVGATIAQSGKVSNALASSVLSSSAFRSGAQDAHARGASDEQALMFGAASALNEFIFENISLEKLDALKATPGKGTKKFFFNLFKHGAVNGSEELFTEIANFAADQSINGNLSKWATDVRNYMSEGISESDARKEATWNLVKDVGLAGLSGFLSGVSTGTIAQSVGNAIQKSENTRDIGRKYLSTSDPEDLVRLAAGQFSNNRSIQSLAAKVQKDASEANVGKLFVALDKAYRSTATAAVKDAQISQIKTALTEQGKTEEDAAALADIIYRKTFVLENDLVSVGDSKKLSGDPVAMEVYNKFRDGSLGDLTLTQEQNDVVTQAQERSRHLGERLLTEEEKAELAEREEIKRLYQVSYDGTTHTEDGTPVKIGKIVSVKDRSITVETDRGEMSLDEISMPDENTALLYSYAADMPTAHAKAFVENYQPGQDLAQYANGFEMYYAYGVAGIDAGKINVSLSNLTAAQKTAAYSQGIKDSGKYKAEQDVVDARKKNGKKTSRSGSVDTSALGFDVKDVDRQKTLTRHQKAEVKVARALAEKLGLQVVFYSSKMDAEGNFKGDHGYYSKAKNTVYLDINAGRKNISDSMETAILATLSHELTHQIRVQSPALYAELQKAVLEELNGINAEAMQRMVNDAMSKDSSLTAEDALEEVVANACEDMLRNDTALRSLLESHKTLGEKIKAFVKDFLNDIKNLLKDLSSNQEISEESALLRSSQEAYNRIAELWAKGLLDASEAGQYEYVDVKPKEGGLKHKNRNTDQVAFIEDKYFSRQIDHWKNLNRTSYITVGEIVEKSPLNLVGIPAGTLYFDVSKLQKEMTGHEDHLSVDIIKKVPALLSNPIVITEYRPGEGTNTANVYGELFYHGRPITVGVVATLSRGKTVISKIRTIHTKGNTKTQITDESILYLNENKKETKKWFQARRQRVPVGGTKFGLIRIIPLFEQKVKSSSENSSEESFDTDVKRRARGPAEKITESITSDDILSLRKVGKKSVNAFTREDLQSSKKWAQKFYEELGVKSPFFRAWYGDWRAHDTTPISTIKVESINLEDVVVASGNYAINDTGWQVHAGSRLVGETNHYARGEKVSVKALSAIKDILKNSVLLDSEVSIPDSKKKKPTTAFMHKLYCPIEYGGRKYLAKLSVEEYYDNRQQQTQRRAYHLRGIKIESADGSFSDNSGTSPRSDTDSIYSIADLFNFVKRSNPNFKPVPVNRDLLNADGTPKLFYHGAKNGGGFNEFRDWSYFTENRAYAERYTQRDSESSLYQTYIKMDRPFDTRKEECRKVFETMRQEYGLSELQDTGLPDWTDGYDIAEFIEENDLDYDGIILDEGGDLVDGKPVSRGLSYVVRDSTQIKAVENAGTFDKWDPNIKHRARDNSDEISVYRSMLSELEAKAETAAERKQISEWRKSVDALEDLSTRQSEAEAALEGKIPDVWESYQNKKQDLALEKQYQRTLKAEIETENRDKEDGYRDRVKDLMADREASFAKSTKLSKEVLQLQEDNPAIQEYETLEKRIGKTKADLSSLRKTDPVGNVRTHAKAEQRLAEQKARYQKTVNRRNEQRKLTEILRDTAKVRDRLISMAKTPTASSYIPKEMVEGVISIVNRMDKINTALRSEKVRQREAELETARRNLDRAEAASHGWEISPAERKVNEAAARLRNTEHYLDTLNREIQDLKNTLDSLRTQKGTESYTAFEMASERLSALSEDLRDTPVSQLTRKQAIALNQAMRLVERAVKDANRITIKGKEKALSETRKKLRGELEDLPQKSRATRKIGGVALNYATPLVFFEEMGGYAKDSEWLGVYNLLNDAQTAYQNYSKQSSSIFDDLLLDEKNHVRKEYKELHDRKVLLDIGLRDEQGNPVEVTRDMVLALYLNTFSNDNMRHVLFGGVSVPDLQEYYKGNQSEAFGDVETKQAVTFGENDLAQYYDAEAEAANKLIRYVESHFEEDSLPFRHAERAKKTADPQSAFRSIENSVGLFGSRADIAAVSSLLQNYEKQRKAFDRRIRELSEEIRKNLKSHMTEWELQLCDRVSSYFNGYAKDLLNKATTETYGYEKATKQNYYPIHTDKAFLEQNLSSYFHGATVEGYGAMKSRTKSEKPILLEGMTDVLQRELDRTARYAAYLKPMNDLKKILGASEADRETLLSTVGTKRGTRYKTYMEKLIRDLSQPSAAKDSWERVLGKLRGNYARAVFTGNLKAGLGSIAAYPVGAHTLGFKPLAKALATGGPGKNFIYKADRELIDTYSSALWYRSQYGLAAMHANTDATSKFFNDRLAWANTIEVVDNVVVGRFWTACEFYVDEHYPGLEKGTPEQIRNGESEYYKKVAEVFRTVIEETEANYSTMQRPQVLRSDSALTKSLTMFQTQNIQNANIVTSSYKRWARYRSDFKTGKNGITKADVDEAGNRFRRALATQIVQNLVYVLSTNAVLFALTPGRYDDDDEETTMLESSGERLLLDFMDTTFASIPVIGEVYSILANIGFDQYYDGVSVTGVDAVSDSIDSWISVIKDLTNGPSWEKSPKKWMYAAEDTSKLFGIPLSNAKKIVQSIPNWIKQIENGEGE